MSQPQHAALEAASDDPVRTLSPEFSPHVLGRRPNNGDTVPARPPFLALPQPLTGPEVQTLYYLAELVATDDTDYTVTKEAIHEANTFLNLARIANGRGDLDAARAALMRAASIVVGATGAVEGRMLAKVAQLRTATPPEDVQ